MSHDSSCIQIVTYILTWFISSANVSISNAFSYFSILNTVDQNSSNIEILGLNILYITSYLYGFLRKFLNQPYSLFDSHKIRINYIPYPKLKMRNSKQCCLALVSEKTPQLFSEDTRSVV